MKILEVVALINDVSEKHLRRGQVGTVVEILAPGMVEVEFSDLDGNPYAMCAVPESSLMVLHHIPDAIAAQESYDRLGDARKTIPVQPGNKLLWFMLVK